MQSFPARNLHQEVGKFFNLIFAVINASFTAGQNSAYSERATEFVVTENKRWMELSSVRL